MRNFYHTSKFSTLTINFSEVWPKQIFDLGKLFNLMIRLENVLKTSLPDVLKTSSKRLEDALKISWRRFCKTYSQDEYLGLDQEVFWRRMTEANIFALIKTPSEDEDKRRLQDVSMKTNVCWVGSSKKRYQGFSK